jgi:hypothetical protein
MESNPTPAPTDAMTKFDIVHDPWLPASPQLPVSFIVSAS